MTKRKRDDHEDAGVQFSSLAASASDASRLAGATGKRGPAPDPTSLRQQLEDGTARWLKVTVPLDVHRAVHVAAAERDEAPSQIVAAALRAYLKV